MTASSPCYGALCAKCSFGAQALNMLMEKASLYEGHGFSRVSMRLRLTQGDENHGEFVFSRAVNHLVA
jgi:hypothetical protein